MTLPSASLTVCRMASCCGSASVRSFGGVRAFAASAPMSVAFEGVVTGWFISRLRAASVERSPPAIIAAAQITISGLVSGLNALFRPARCAGRCSSKIKCALLPPNPKLLIAARLGDLSLRQGEGADKTSRLECWICSNKIPETGVGGRLSRSIAPVSFNILAKPATVIRWPVFAFREPMGRCSSLA